MFLNFCYITFWQNRLAVLIILFISSMTKKIRKWQIHPALTEERIMHVNKMIIEDWNVNCEYKYTKFVLETVDSAFTGIIMRFCYVSIWRNIVSRSFNVLCCVFWVGRTTPWITNTLRSRRMSQPVPKRQIPQMIIKCLFRYASKTMS